MKKLPKRTHKGEKMAADNWTRCPKCDYQNQQKYDITRAKLAVDYGKIPPEEYIKRSEELEKPPEFPECVREDYEIGIEDGVFKISYSAQCTTEGCDFSFHYKYSKNVDITKRKKENV